MTDQQRQAIKLFFESAKKLKSLGIIRSNSYSGNIAEFICSDIFQIRLSNSQREVGLDGFDPDGRKVEIKYHNGESRTNIDMSKYVGNQNFQDLIIILGPQSKLKSTRTDEELYEIYRINDYVCSPNIHIAKNSLEGYLIKTLNSKLE